jgi:hypothetical protein
VSPSDRRVAGGKGEDGSGSVGCQTKNDEGLTISETAGKMPNMGERKAMFSTRLPPAVLRRLRDAADRGGYRLAALVERWIVAGLDALEEREPGRSRKERRA